MLLLHSTFIFLYICLSYIKRYSSCKYIIEMFFYSSNSHSYFMLLFCFFLWWWWYVLSHYHPYLPQIFPLPVFLCFSLFTIILIWMFWISLLPTESKISGLSYYKCMGETEYENNLVWNSACIFTILTCRAWQKLPNMKENYQPQISQTEMLLKH